MLTIDYLLLKNFKRFPLRDIELFEHEFKSKLFLITGQNGAGKTSLLNEITPLPSDKNNFNKQGYKEIRITKDGNKYRLICDFTTNAKYSFLLNEEELNNSNNVTTQKELVEKHFNITSTVHDLITGIDTFTNLSLVNRKKLFSSITNINIDGILEAYNTLKEEYKNNEVLLKSQTSILQAEESKLANNSHLNDIKDKAFKVREHIDFLLNVRQELHKYRFITPLDDIYTDFTKINSKIKELLSKYYSYIVIYPYNTLSSVKLQYSNELSSIKSSLDSLYDTLQVRQQELKYLQLSKDTNINTLVIRKKELEEYSSSSFKTLRFFKSLDTDTNRTRNSIHILESSLSEILLNIPINENKEFSKDKYNSYLSSKKELIEQMTLLSNKELILNKELIDLNNHNDNVSCPKCNHTWSLKDIPSLITKNKETLKELLVNKLKIQESISSLDKEIDKQVNYFSLYERYSNIRSSTYLDLKPLWEYIDTEELIFKKPTKILPLITSIGLDISEIEEIIKSNKEIESINKNIDIYSNYKDTSTLQIEEIIENTLQTIEDTNSYKNYIESKLEDISKIDKLYSYVESVSKATETLLESLMSVNIHKLSSDMLNSIESDLATYKVTLVSLEKEISNYENIQYTISKHKEVIQETNTNLKVLKLLIDEISPKNGLIAKVVSSFLNVIITSINKTIESVWSYKMILSTIDIESENLTYKFRLEVEDKLSVDDISKASKGMQNIINLSFVMVLYKLLGLNGYPLLLDELGSNLDKEHTITLANMLSSLSVSDKFSQIFIITHKENYSFLKGIETIDLN